MGVKKNGVRNWLDDILIPTRTFEEQLELLRETFDCLRQSKLSAHLPKVGVLFLGGRVVGDDHGPLRYQACS